MFNSPFLPDINAKTQSRKDAKGRLPFSHFASLRLGVFALNGWMRQVQGIQGIALLLAGSDAL
jgi:hypothetical protein